ncbi:MAG TPA: hypothetical protein VGD89_14095 [Flavipsychrobacter sp.]
MQNPQSFQNRLRDKITSDIASYTDQYFELDVQQSAFAEKEQERQYNYRSCMNAPSSQKIAWVFFLMLAGFVAIMDYASIVQFFTYLSKQSGGATGAMIKSIGGVFFVAFELGIGIVMLRTKSPFVKTVTGIIAVALCLLPAFLIYSGYAINPNKTSLLLYKTIALMVLSIIIHAFFFLCIADIWAAMNYVVYCVTKWSSKAKDPQRKMKTVKKELQALYPDFDHHVIISVPAEQVAQLLHNRAWYLKGKLQSGGTQSDYDLSDYDPNISYAPANN